LLVRVALEKEAGDGDSYLQETVDNLSADIVRMSSENSRCEELIRAARDVIFGREKVIYTPKAVLLATIVVERGLATRHETDCRPDLEEGKKRGEVIVTFVLRRQAQIRPEGVINRILRVTRLGDNLLEFC
jgi:hypothetical protein